MKVATNNRYFEMCSMFCSCLKRVDASAGAELFLYQVGNSLHGVKQDLNKEQDVIFPCGSQVSY